MARVNQQPTTAQAVYQTIGSFPNTLPMRTNNQLTTNNRAGRLPDHWQLSQHSSHENQQPTNNQQLF